MTLLQKIVKNEAMKHDPPEIYGWRVFVLAMSASSSRHPKAYKQTRGGEQFVNI